MKYTVMTAAFAAALVALLAVGCTSSKDERVKTNYMTQWVNVAADTGKTTDAAKAVLDGEGLKNVIASSTAIDGMAKGQMADGTAVKASIAKITDTTSKVSVTVGTMGDPKVGGELAKKIMMKAEGK